MISFRQIKFENAFMFKKQLPASMDYTILVPKLMIVHALHAF